MTNTSANGRRTMGPRLIALVGPFQSGKTTLARHIVPSASANYFDLEDPASLARLSQPMTALGELRGTVVIDEIQHRPDAIYRHCRDSLNRLRPTIQRRSMASKRARCGEKLARGRVGSRRGILSRGTAIAPDTGGHTAVPAQFAERSPRC